MTTFREFRARSAHFGQIWGWDESRGARVFCVVIQRTFRQLRNGRFSQNLVTKRTSVSRREIPKNIFENFHFRGHLPTKTEIASRANRPSLRAGYRSRDALHCFLHVVVQVTRSFRLRSTFLYDVRLRSNGASKLPNFSDFGLFPHRKSLKSTFWQPAYSLGVTSQNDYDFYRASAYLRAILM